MRRVQLTENDRKSLINAAAFGFTMPASEAGLNETEADEISGALIEAREHIATTSDDVAYVIIRVEAKTD